MSNESLTTKRQVLGQVLVCSGCCCGRTDKGKPEIPLEWLKKSWKSAGLLKKIQLTISGCLGPCDLVNVVCILTPTEQIWLGGLTETHEYEALFQWAVDSVQQESLLELPQVLDAHQFSRYVSTL